MLTRPRVRRILSLGLPILGGMVSQNLLNLVDTAMVGVLGDAALGATGIGNAANFLATAFITGLSAGVQSVAARRKGEARVGETAVPLNGGVLLAIVLGLPLALVLWLLCPVLFPLLSDDPAVVRAGVPYVQMRLLGLLPLGINFAFRGYWNAVDMSGKYLRTLVVMHVSNVALAWVLIYGHLGAPALGVRGAGLATTIATWIGTAYYVALAWRHARQEGFLRGMPDRTTMLSMLKVSLPSALQQLFFAAGMTALFAIVALVGTAEVAAANVLLNLTLVGVLPGLGFGLAASTLVGQSLGQGEPQAARQWGWDVAKLAVLVIAALSIVAALVPDLVLSGFLHDASTRALARLPLRLIAIALPIDAIGIVLLNALIGAGDARRTMIVAVVFQWVVFIPGAYLVGPVLGGGLVAIWILQGVYRLAQTAVFARMWAGDRWAAVRL